MNAGALSRCSAASFEARYRGNSDPWDFASCAYEQNRYTVLMESLPRQRYGRAFEPGCSVGALTERLASRCDQILATDASPTAVEVARQRCASLTNIEFRCGALENTPPEGVFDLIVLSEIGYYFTPEVLSGIVGQLAGSLRPGADFLAAHWLGHSEDHVLHGDEVHAVLATHLPFNKLLSREYDGFRLDLWRKE